MLSLFDINNTAFMVMSYPMSWLELMGVLFNLACVILVARKHISTWPIGIVGAMLFILMFWQIQLYSDAILNLYFVITGFMGWWLWWKTPGAKDETSTYSFSSKPMLLTWALVTAVAAVLWGSFMKHAHDMLPSLFTQPAAYPMWDGAILMASFVAQWLMMKKKTECWAYWIAIDLAAITLYWVKDIKFTSLLYVGFLGIATYGLVHWSRSHKKSEEQVTTNTQEQA